ncbi:MAG: hypothetical protein QOK29_5082, partial [Rhodospirillaceae bacterium]|nr:hypothetical protein [Rhodospirillaceae bacterium]
MYDSEMPNDNKPLELLSGCALLELNDKAACQRRYCFDGSRPRARYLIESSEDKTVASATYIRSRQSGRARRSLEFGTYRSFAARGSKCRHPHVREQARAAHYFATFFDNSRLIKLHFEHLHCD